MKKTSRNVGLVMGAVLLCSSVVACDKPGAVQAIKDPLVCNIQVIKAGYGVDWLYELKAKFEAAYAEEGYKLNILTPSYDMRGSTVQQLLYQGYDSTGVDLYITGDLFPNLVGANSDYGVIASDLRENVWNKKAIGYDGEEEEYLVSEKCNSGLEKYTLDNTGVMYGFNWVSSAAGMVINKTKLTKYGITEYPNTTNEMFDIFEKIYLGTNGLGNSEETKTFPFVYNGYYGVSTEIWLAQYDVDEYTQFTTMEKDGAAMKANGYEVYNLPGVTETVAANYRLFDINIASYGSVNQTLDQAQAALIKPNGNNAVFMMNGDWFMNEVKLNYKNNLGDLDFMNVPVISALGTKLFGVGTSYNLSNEKCDELLSDIIDLVDENKTIDEIVAAISATGVTVAKEDVEDIARARGICYSRGVEHMAYIDKNAKAKNVAELLLRMMASEDFANTFAELANGTTPYTKSVNTYGKYEYIANASKILVNDYASIINNMNMYQGYRKSIGLSTTFRTTADLPTTIATSSDAPSVYDMGKKVPNASYSVYRTAATTFLEKEYSNLQKNWGTLTAGK